MADKEEAKDEAKDDEDTRPINERLKKYELGIRYIPLRQLVPWAKVRGVNRPGVANLKKLIKANGYSQRFPLTVRDPPPSRKPVNYDIVDGQHRQETVGELADENWKDFDMDFKVHEHAAISIHEHASITTHIV